MNYMILIIMALSSSLFAGSPDPATAQDWERYRLALKNLSDNNFITSADYDKFVGDQNMNEYFYQYKTLPIRDAQMEFEVLRFDEQKKCSASPANPSSSSASSDSESFLSSVGSAITFPFRWLFGKTGNSQEQNLASECDKIRVKKGLLNLVSFSKEGRYIQDDRGKLAAQQSSPTTSPATQAAATTDDRYATSSASGAERYNQTSATPNQPSTPTAQPAPYLRRYHGDLPHGIVMWENSDGTKGMFIPQGMRHQTYIDEAEKTFNDWAATSAP